MAANGTVFGAVVVAGALGLFIGHWQGESTAEENFRRILLYADLPPACEQMLRNGSADLNDAQKPGPT